MVAAPASGVGKTTVCSAICAALVRAGHVVQPFKTGPDFVDPTYLSLGAGRTCGSLDGFPNPDLMPFFYEQRCKAGGGADIAVVEGVMGLYDGLGPDGLYSTAWLARSLDLPVILLIDASAAAVSAAALVHGFATFKPLAPRVAGVIANRVSGEGHAEVIRDALERFTGIPLVGWLPKMPDVEFPSRHLGLVPAAERRNTEEKLALAADAVCRSVDLECLVKLAEIPRAPCREPELPGEIRKADGASVKVAVARDEAFCFHYAENWELMRRIGAEIIYTSPVHDDSLPAEMDVLILPGGYPEEFAGELSANSSYLESLRSFAPGGSIYAECGGMMYLTNALCRGEGRFPMAGLIDADAVMTDRLQRFGYVNATPRGDNLLFRDGEEVRAHEFHYSRLAPDSAEMPDAFSVRRASGRGKAWIDGFSKNGGRLLAAYLHVNFYSCPRAALRLLRSALRGA